MIDIKKYRQQFWIIAPSVALIISFIYIIGFHDGESNDYAFAILSNLMLTLGLWAGCVYIVNYLWTKYPWQLHPIKHLLIELGSILIFTNIFLSILVYVTLRYFDFGNESFSSGELFQNYLEVNLITLLITAIHEAIYFYRQWKENFSKSARLEKDHIQAKYEALKTQINPHFLFNSLNSLVGLVDENKEAVDYIDNLSDFLRYMLKSNDHELVSLRSEIEILDRYIRLQKTRFNDNLQFMIDINEKYYHYSVPPLVIQMLVENAIKHNVISKEYPLTISIKAQKESILIENNLQLKSEVVSTGQGLNNIQQRYAFFTTHEVIIKQTPAKYSVEIPLLIVEL